MPEDRIKFALRISVEKQKLIRQIYKKDNCVNQNELFEKAIEYWREYRTYRHIAFDYDIGKSAIGNAVI